MTNKAYHRWLMTGWTCLCAVLILTSASCNESSLVGGGIVNPPDSNLDTALFEISLVQIEPTPFVAYDGQRNRTTLPTQQLGWMEDTYFGKSTAAFSMQVVPPPTILEEDVVYIVDSVVLVLFLDSLGYYGTPGEVRVNVDRLASPLEGDMNYRSDFTPILGERLVENVAIGQSFVIDTTEGDLLGTTRIRMPNSLGEEILALDSLTRIRDSSFVMAFPGFHLSPSEQSEGYVGLNPYVNTDAQGMLGAGLRIYLRDALVDTNRVTYVVRSEASNQYSPVVPSYAYDFAGAMAEDILNGATDDIFLVQGQSGLNVAMTINGLEDRLRDVLVLKAECTIPIQENEPFYDAFEHLVTIQVMREELNGLSELVPEFSSSNLFSVSPQGRLDSSGVQGELGYTYNLPETVQTIIDRELFETTLRLTSRPVSNEPFVRQTTGPANLRRAAARSILRRTDTPIIMRVIYAFES